MIIIDRQANKKSINDWKWLLSLLTYHDAPLFPYVNHIFVEHGCTYSTDGHRIHCMELSELNNPIAIEPGTYRVAFNSAEFILIPETVKFPDIESVWPSGGNGERRLQLNGTLSKCLSVFNSESENLYNVDYIQDALGMKRAGAELVHAEVFFHGPVAPVSIVYKPRKALVMPMKE